MKLSTLFRAYRVTESDISTAESVISKEKRHQMTPEAVAIAYGLFTRRFRQREFIARVIAFRLRQLEAVQQ